MTILPALIHLAPDLENTFIPIQSFKRLAACCNTWQLVVFICPLASSKPTPAHFNIHISWIGLFRDAKTVINGSSCYFFYWCPSICDASILIVSSQTLLASLARYVRLISSVLLEGVSSRDSWYTIDLSLTRVLDHSNDDLHRKAHGRVHSSRFWLSRKYARLRGTLAHDLFVLSSTFVSHRVFFYSIKPL